MNKLPKVFNDFYDLLQGGKQSAFYPVSSLQCMIVDLSVAHNNDRLEVQGDFIYSDIDSVGESLLGFNNANTTKIPCYPGFGLRGFPIKEMYITSLAQPDGKLRLWFGYGCEFNLTNVYSESSNLIENHDTGVNLATTTKAGAVIDLALNVSLQLINPASNLNGIILWDAQFSHTILNGAAGTGNLSLSALPAPLNVTGGPGIIANNTFECLAFSGATIALSNRVIIARIGRPYRLPPGIGLYATSDNPSIAASGYFWYVYDIL